MSQYEISVVASSDEEVTNYCEKTGFYKTLNEACSDCDWERVRKLIDDDGGVHTISSYILRVAADHGQLDLVKYLVEEKNVDIEPRQCLALSFAAGNGHLHVVEYLIGKGVLAEQNHNWAIRDASMEGHLPVVKFLVEHGANPRQNDDFCLFWAFRKGHIGLAEYLISKGADVNSRDDLLDAAVTSGKLEIVKFLFSDTAFKHSSKKQVVQYAIERGHTHILKYLEEQGYTVTADDLKSLFFRMYRYFQPINSVLYATRKIQRDQIVFRGDFIENLWREWEARMIILVNAIKGTIRCGDHNGIHSHFVGGVMCLRVYPGALSHTGNTKEQCTECQEWGRSEYYDPNLGMLVCSYID